MSTINVKRIKKLILLVVGLLALLLIIALITTHAHPTFDYAATLTVSCPELGYENVRARATVDTLVPDQYTGRVWMIRTLIIEGNEYSLYVFVDPGGSNSGKDRDGNSWRISFPAYKARRLNLFS